MQDILIGVLQKQFLSSVSLTELIWQAFLSHFFPNLSLNELATESSLVVIKIHLSTMGSVTDQWF